ncbi:uncharacterized protein LOC131319155 [Rhododendron vialii]|uniref:uncharacterized protein LOC131319155 n=1 Tax=Rhododendron vialii TaxID=182163 RepID=UPI00265FD4E2|nr:uncharacterized protein LOC131319155 [Rhododendron vialii]
MASQASKQLEPWCNLNGKVVLVTGASSGLGWEFCLDLARAQCRIVAAARWTDRLKTLCDQINQPSFLSSCGPSKMAHDHDEIRAVAIELDVTSNGQTIEVAVQKAWEAFGHIDALINNAGVRGSVSSSLELSEEEWNNTTTTNITGAWLVSKYVGKCMRDGGRGGSIINISSIQGLNRIQIPGALAYASSKGAMHILTKTMALEMGKHNIRVNAIAAGLFRSEFTESLFQKDWLNNVALRTIPLRTWGESDPALTSIIRYSIHDSSDYVSGNIFIVDAGYTLPGIPIFSSL